MGTLRHIQDWSATHHPRWLVVLRIGLGLCLFAKGILFMSNSVYLEELIARTPMAEYSGWLPILITCANLLGGFLLIVGLLTRWAALIQIPILLGAIIFINAQKGSGLVNGSELSMAIVVLVLLIVFLVEGGGPLSLDSYFYKNRGNSRGTNL
ncbi:DoxX family protein [Flavitalea flava]